MIGIGFLLSTGVDFGAYGVTGIYALLLTAGFAFIIALLKGWIIVKPWYDKIEAINAKLQASNDLLTATNAKLVDQIEKIADELDLKSKLK